MSYFNTIRAADSPSIDAFGRWRTSEPLTVFDSKLILDNQPLLWDDSEVSGSGTTSTYQSDESAVDMAVSVSTAGKRVRQTFMRFNYQSGKSQLILMTGVLGSVGSGVKSGFGYYDDNNGLFLQNNEGTVQFVRRTGTSGSAVDNTVNQSSWNIDPMDGTGVSGKNLDFTKTQILIIDFEWLGVGRVRLGFVVDGVICYAHEFLNANNLTTVYMTTPNLPLRYEIENTGSGAASTLKQICCSVISEGGVNKNGVLRGFSNQDTLINANTSGTIYALCGIRLKSTALDAAIDLVSASVLSATNDNFEWMFILNPTVSTGITFSDETNSGVQTGPGNAGNPSTSTVTGGTILFTAYGAASTSIISDQKNAVRLGSAIDGTVDEIYLCVRPLAANADYYGSITWRELQ